MLAVIALLSTPNSEAKRERERDTHLIDFSAGKQQKLITKKRKKLPAGQHLVNAAVIAFFNSITRRETVNDC